MLIKFKVDLFAAGEIYKPTIIGPERVHITILPGNVYKRGLAVYLSSKGSNIFHD